MNTLNQILGRALSEHTSHEARRLLHGRGGTVPDCSDFSADLYWPLLFLVSYRSLPLDEYNTLASMLKILLNRSRELGTGISGAVLQVRGPGGAVAGVAAGRVPQSFTVAEQGLNYLIEPLRGQNPGLFLDMRNGRSLVRGIASGGRVLNLFAYTCSFSVAAAAGGAVEVVNIDMKAGVLARGRENHHLNPRATGDCRLEFIRLDLMKSFSRIDRMGEFDLIIIDPPSRQGRSFDYRRDYAKILRRSRRWLPAGGRMLTCLNAPEAGEDWLERLVGCEFPELALESSIYKGEDFPEADESRRRIGILWRLV